MFIKLNNTDTRRLNEFTKATYKCQHCGHSILFYNREVKKICSHCGYYAFKNDKDRFNFLLNQELKKVR